MIFLFAHGYACVVAVDGSGSGVAVCESESSF